MVMSGYACQSTYVFKEGVCFSLTVRAVDFTVRISI